MPGYQPSLRDRANLLTNTLGLTVWAEGREGDVALVELCALNPTAVEVEAARVVIRGQHEATLADSAKRPAGVLVDSASITFWDRQARKSAARRDRMLEVLTRYESVVHHWERYGHL